MANPAQLALDRPRIVVLATLLLLIYGVLSFLELPRQENPSFNQRYASIYTYLPGAEPEKVEILITKVIEDKIAEVDDIEDIFSTSRRGVSSIIVEVSKTARVDLRMGEIRDKAREARALLPPSASEPEVDTRTTRTNTLVLAVTGHDASPLLLRKKAKELKRRLEALPDVRKVELVGMPREEIEVAVDLGTASQRGIPLARIIEALASRNIHLPSGALNAGGVESSLETSGAFDTTGDLTDTYLGVGSAGLPIRLPDVATIARGLAERETAVFVNGRPCVALGVEMLPHRNAIALGKRVRRLIDDFHSELPDGMSVEIVADEPTYVGERLALLGGSLLFGLLLVIVLTVSGLGWRTGGIVSLSIPVSLAVAMGFLSLAGIALHQISIAALVIAIGLVVDESIVVADNIQRHLDRGANPRDAAIRGLGEIHLAILAGAATTIAAFIPLMIMQGDIGDFVRSIPLVVTLMLFASVMVAHFLTPLLAAHLYERLPGSSLARRRRGDTHGRRYRRLVEMVIARPRQVLALFGLGFVASLGLLWVVLWPPDFFPDADRHQFLIKVALPTGAPLEETTTVMQAIEEILARDPALASWTAFVGDDAPKFYYNVFPEGQAENLGMFVVNTRSEVSFRRNREIVGRLDRELKANIVGAQVRVLVLRQGYSAADDIEVFVVGDNLDLLRTLAARVREIVREVPGVVNDRDSFGYDPVTIEAQIDEAKANLLGVSHRDIATTLRTAIDGVPATTFREDDEEIDIVVRLTEDQRTDIEDLAALPISSPTLGETVPFSHVAALAVGWTTRRINRYERKRQAVVSADLESGYSLFEVGGQVEQKVRAEARLPHGYSVEFFGQRKEVNESFLSLARAAIVAVFLIYIILVLRFQSLMHRF